MKLYAICLVRDEEDIIAQTLSHAAGYCDKVFVLDNGSTDRTWQIVQSLATTNPRIIAFAQTFEPYSNALRAKVYNAVHRDLDAKDWWLILDSDEFLAEDPKPLLGQASDEGADAIRTWQIQFYFTEVDYQAWVEGRDNRDIPIFDRRRYYLVNWQELRLFRNQPSKEWAAGAWNPDKLHRVWRRRILNRHYQFRDPVQIQRRLQLRLKTLEGFRHVKATGSTDWRTVMRSSRSLNVYRDGEPWRFSLSGITYYQRRRLFNALQAKYRGALRRLRALVLHFRSKASG
jgi:glycosyltransferase involved in cell wall biosynthesis